MKELLNELLENIMKYFYSAVEDDVTYSEDADRLLAILDDVLTIEHITDMKEVCDSMRSDVVDMARGDNVEMALGLQIVLHTIKDLKAAHEIMSGFTRATIEWRRGIMTYKEATQAYTDTCRDVLHATMTFSEVRDYTWTEIWDFFHLKDEVM